MFYIPVYTPTALVSCTCQSKPGSQRERAKLDNIFFNFGYFWTRLFKVPGKVSACLWWLCLQLYQYKIKLQDKVQTFNLYCVASKDDKYFYFNLTVSNVKFIYSISVNGILQMHAGEINNFRFEYLVFSRRSASKWDGNVERLIKSYSTGEWRRQEDDIVSKIIIWCE